MIAKKISQVNKIQATFLDIFLKTKFSYIY